jgi:hypothetical protein
LRAAKAHGKIDYNLLSPSFIGPTSFTESSKGAAIMTSTEPVLVQPAVATPSVSVYSLFQLKLGAVLRSWATWLGIIGIAQLAISHLSGPWGVVLLLVAGACMLFKVTGMLVVCATLLAWAAISNMISGELRWIGFGVFQVYLSYSTIRQYLQFRRWERAIAAAADAGSDQAAGLPRSVHHVFPWAGCGLSILAAMGLIAGFVGSVVSTPAEPAWAGWVIQLGLDLAVVGLGVSLASLLAGYRWKLVAVLGLVGSGIVFLVVLDLLLFARLGG